MTKLFKIFLVSLSCLTIYSFTSGGKLFPLNKEKMKNLELNTKGELVIIGENNQTGAIHETDSNLIGIIELRNYVIKRGLRDSFIHYFEENFIEPQEALKGYLLGQYRVKGFEDNFCWIRGFKDMKERSAFLPAFYYGPVWKQHKVVANSMLANNDKKEVSSLLN